MIENKITKLIMDDEELRKSIISDFTQDFLNEINKLVDTIGREEFCKLLHN